MFTEYYQFQIILAYSWSEYAIIDNVEKILRGIKPDLIPNVISSTFIIIGSSLCNYH